LGHCKWDLLHDLLIVNVRLFLSQCDEEFYVSNAKCWWHVHAEDITKLICAYGSRYCLCIATPAWKIYSGWRALPWVKFDVAGLI
jgi:hypothetical protein